jgi:predicted small lipoprotein YifL
MKVFLHIAALLALTGCGDKKSAPPPSANTNASQPASGGYLNAIVKGEQKAQKTVDVASLNQAIQLFNVDKGRYPIDLNELVKEKFIAELPPIPYGTRLDYDPATGQAKVVNK